MKEILYICIQVEIIEIQAIQVKVFLVMNSLKDQSFALPFNMFKSHLNLIRDCRQFFGDLARLVMYVCKNENLTNFTNLIYKEHVEFP